jgi:hypothetical protein
MDAWVIYQIGTAIYNFFQTKYYNVKGIILGQGV